jgi:Helicase associated domain
MGNKKWGSSFPAPEWVTLYRQGMTRGQIAKRYGAPISTVGSHLAAARARDPRLALQHQIAAGTTRASVTTRGLVRMNQLITMVQKSGRYPVRNAQDVSERALAKWLHRRRQDVTNGRLASVFREGLEVLPGWEEVRTKPHDLIWRQRLAALAAYRASSRELSPQDANPSPEERELLAWVHKQRVRLLRCELDKAKIDALDEIFPDWRKL